MTRIWAALAAGAGATIASAAPIFSENFESYANQAAVEAVWPKTAPAGAGLELSTGDSHSAPQSMYSAGALARRNYRNFGLEALPAAGETLYAEFWMTIPAGGTTNMRQYCELRGYAGAGFDPGLAGGGTLQDLIAVGVTNVTAGGANVFQARLAFGGSAFSSTADASGWFNLNLPGTATRTTGWHKLAIEIIGSGDASKLVNFYVDGVLGGFATDTSGSNTYDSFILGSGLTSNTASPRDSYFDDVSVKVTPEPAALGALLLGGALLRRRG